MALAALALVMDYVYGWAARRAVGRNIASGQFGAQLGLSLDYMIVFLCRLLLATLLLTGGR